MVLTSGVKLWFKIIWNHQNGGDNTKYDRSCGLFATLLFKPIAIFSEFLVRVDITGWKGQSKDLTYGLRYPTIVNNICSIKASESLNKSIATCYPT